MTHPNPPEMVTQADREAAAEYLAMIAPTMPNLAEGVRTKQSTLARAFARHRLRHTPDREAIINLIRDQMMSNDYPVSPWEEQFADAIIAICEGGIFRTAKGRQFADKLVRQCKDHAQVQLRAYDREPSK